MTLMKITKKLATKNKFGLSLPLKASFNLHQKCLYLPLNLYNLRWSFQITNFDQIIFHYIRYTNSVLRFQVLTKIMEQQIDNLNEREIEEEEHQREEDRRIQQELSKLWQTIPYGIGITLLYLFIVAMMSASRSGEPVNITAGNVGGAIGSLVGLNILPVLLALVFKKKSRAYLIILGIMLFLNFGIRVSSIF